MFYDHALSVRQIKIKELEIKDTAALMTKRGRLVGPAIQSEARNAAMWLMAEP